MTDCLFNLAFIGPGGPEVLVVMLVLLMMFGAKDAPRILRKLNEIINQIRNTADGFKREVMYGDLNTETPTYDEPPDNTDESHPEGDDYEYGEDDGDAGAEISEEPEIVEIDSEQPEDEDGDAQKT